MPINLRNLRDFLNGLPADDPRLEKNLVICNEKNEYEPVLELGIIAGTQGLIDDEVKGCVALFSNANIDMVEVDDIVVITIPNT